MQRWKRKVIWSESARIGNIFCLKWFFPDFRLPLHKTLTLSFKKIMHFCVFILPKCFCTVVPSGVINESYCFLILFCLYLFDRWQRGGNVIWEKQEKHVWFCYTYIRESKPKHILMFLLTITSKNSLLVVFQGKSRTS